MVSLTFFYSKENIHMSKRLTDLVAFIENNEFAYKPGNKTILKRKGKAAFKELGELLGLQEMSAHFNQGGIAVGGDLMLIGLWEEGKGIYINFSADSFSSQDHRLMYRSVTHMKDWTGGRNQWTSISSLLDTDQFVERMKQVW
jgi:hypothetical protein